MLLLIMLFFCGCNSYLTWSPDGKTIVCSGLDDKYNPSSLVLIDIESGKKTRLSNNTFGSYGREVFPRYSPDGKQIAFIGTYYNMGTKETTASIYLFDTLKKSVKEVYNYSKSIKKGGGGAPSVNFNYFSWSPDGNYLAFHVIEESSSAAPEKESTKSSIWKININSLEKKQLTTAKDGSCSHPNWSNDGKIYFTSGFNLNMTKSNEEDSNIWIIGADGSNKQKLTDYRLFESAVVGPSAVSPDGLFIAYSIMSKNPNKKDPGQVCIMNLKDKSVTKISEGVEDPKHKNNMWVYPQFSRDGKKILYNDMGGQSPPVTIIIDIESKSNYIYDGMMSAAWSPDSNKIAFYDTKDKAYCSMGIDGKNKKQLLESISRYLGYGEDKSSADPESKLKSYEEIIELYPSRKGEALKASLNILKYEIRDMNRTLEWGEKHFIEFKPESFIDTYIEAGKIDKAINEYEGVIKKYRNDNIEITKHVIETAEKRLKFIKSHIEADTEALIMYYKAMGIIFKKSQNQSPYPYYYRARNIEKEAVDLIQTILKKYPESKLMDEVYCWLGDISSGEDAANYYRELQNRFPDSEWCDLSQYKLVELYSSEKKYEKCIEEGRILMRKYPLSKMVLNCLTKIGDSYKAMNLPDNAIAAYKESLAIYYNPYIQEQIDNFRFIKIGDKLRTTSVLLKGNDLWARTIGDKIVRYNLETAKLTTYTGEQTGEGKHEGFWYSSGSSLIGSNKEKIWFVSNKGLLCFDNVLQKWQIVSPPKDLWVTSIAVSNDRIWCTSKSLLSFHPDTGEWKPFNLKTKENKEFSPCNLVLDGEFLWLYDENGNLFKFNQKTYEHEEMPKNDKQLGRNMKVVGDNLWVTSKGGEGVFKYNKTSKEWSWLRGLSYNKTKKMLEKDLGPTEDRVQSIEAYKNMIWLSTSEQLVEYNIEKNKWKSYRRSLVGVNIMYYSDKYLCLSSSNFDLYLFKIEE